MAERVLAALPFQSLVPIQKKTSWLDRHANLEDREKRN
jgi:hypothetical protein